MKVKEKERGGEERARYTGEWEREKEKILKNPNILLQLGLKNEILL